jgi:1,4-alpha-glucan branching enzyme
MDNRPVAKNSPLNEISLLTDDDLFLFNQGKHFHIYRKLGAHLMEYRGRKGTYFAVWAPNAKQVAVMGDFSQWNQNANLLSLRGQSGIWEGFIPGVEQGSLYKYHIVSRYHNFQVDKADPLAFYSQTAPSTASIVWDLRYQWNDEAWMCRQKEANALTAPISVYEMHLGSWRRTDDNLRPLTYRELAPQLAAYIKKTGFTHVEFLPVMEHPFTGSWGYQITAFFAPTSRYGTPQDFKFLVDYLHQNQIGVILDWAPSHFPSDEHGLVYFDGTHLYENSDPRRSFHPDWKSYIFDYGRKEVQSFLISNAIFWLDQFHADGIRVDGVASMLYLDYSRKRGEWLPNKYGGKENLEAIDFIKTLNEQIYHFFPAVQTIAEESTSWPMVSHPTYLGGLGFGLKWDMGWMHDTLYYLSLDPVFRKYQHNKLTFRNSYALNENFMLPLSHDEVVYGKGSLINKMPGNKQQKLASLRLLLSYMYATPGKKLLFMGAEFGQPKEWNHDGNLEWEVSQTDGHREVSQFLTDLNRVYRAERALYEQDFSKEGFVWIDCADIEKSILSFQRLGRRNKEQVIVILNFTPVARFDYRIGVPVKGTWQEILNSDAREYGGEGYGNFGEVITENIPFHGYPYSMRLTVPPLGAIYFKPQKGDE